MTEPSNEYESALLRHVAEMERAAGMIAAILQECGEYNGITKETQYGRIAVLLNEKEEGLIKKGEALLEEVEREMDWREKVSYDAMKFLLLVELMSWEETMAKKYAKEDRMVRSFALADVIVKAVRETVGVKDKRHEYCLSYALIKNLEKWELGERQCKSRDKHAIALVDLVVKTVQEVNEL
jgi:hypothetical protein